MICLPVEELKNICRVMIKNGTAKKIMGGDDSKSEILLLPIRELTGLIGQAF